jgi:hypothetical protein
MKLGARAAMKSTAQKSGVPWDETVTALNSSEVYHIKEEVENKGMAYPSYYLKPFHGYDEGNMNWQAAFEVEPATEVSGRGELAGLDVSPTPRNNNPIFLTS